MRDVLKGKIVYLNGELMVEHSPRKLFAELGGQLIERTYYRYDILDPFGEHNLNEGDVVDFVFERYIDNGGSFKFCEIIK